LQAYLRVGYTILGINEKTAMMKTQTYECVCVDVMVRAKKRAETALNAH